MLLKVHAVGSIKSETVNVHTGDVNVLAASAESLVAGLVLQGSGPDLGIINQEGLDDSKRKTILKNKWAPNRHSMFPRNGQNQRYSRDRKKNTHG